MDSALSKKKILINAVWRDCFLALTHYDNLRYFITVRTITILALCAVSAGFLLGSLWLSTCEGV